MSKKENINKDNNQAYKVEPYVCDYAVIDTKTNEVVTICNQRNNALMICHILNNDDENIGSKTRFVDFLSEILSNIKGISVGTTTAVNDKFILDYYGESYVCKLTPIPQTVDPMNNIQKCLVGEVIK